MDMRFKIAALALGALTLAGCSTSANKAPAVTTPAPVVTAPAAPIGGTGVELEQISDNGSIGNPLTENQVIATEGVNVEIEELSGNGSAGTPFSENEVVTSIDNTGADLSDIAGDIGAGESSAELQREPDFAEQTDFTELDTAINNCIQGGGTIVSWVGGDEEQACRQEDGLEYRLADAAFFTN